MSWGEVADVAVAVCLVIGALLGTTLWVLRPFIGPGIWAAMVVVATWPGMRRLQARLGQPFVVVNGLFLCLGVSSCENVERVLESLLRLGHLGLFLGAQVLAEDIDALVLAVCGVDGLAVLALLACDNGSVELLQHQPPRLRDCIVLLLD